MVYGIENNCSMFKCLLVEIPEFEVVNITVHVNPMTCCHVLSWYHSTMENQYLFIIVLRIGPFSQLINMYA